MNGDCLQVEIHLCTEIDACCETSLEVETHLCSLIDADCEMILVLELYTVEETDSGKGIVEEGSEHAVHRPHLRQNRVDSRRHLQILLPFGACVG